MDTLLKVIDFLTTAMTIIIVAVPEGMPLAVSMAAAFSMDAMKKDNLLVKHGKALENMAMVNEICTGKTATITNNLLTVSSFYVGGQFIENDEP